MVAMPEAEVDTGSVVIKNLRYNYPNDDKDILTDFSLELPPGSRCLLSGANGAGKTTMLQILAGKTMVSQDAVRVIGKPPFHDIQLTCSGDLSYLGAQWRRNIGSAVRTSFEEHEKRFFSCPSRREGFLRTLPPSRDPGALPSRTPGPGIIFIVSFPRPLSSPACLFLSQGSVALAGDITAGKMIFGVEGVDPERRARLVELLDIDVDWNMMHVSDGQRRRVQICMGLLKPFKVLLCDEITVDLDILGRLDLLKFLAEECEQRGATVVYATHIFDGMEAWMTHIAFASNGELRYGGAKESIEGLKGVRHLLSTIDKWLRVDRDERRAREAKEALEPKKPKAPKMESRHMAYFR